MRLNVLQQAINNIPGDRLALISDACQITYGELQEQIIRFSEQHFLYLQKKIAVKFASRSVAAWMLPQISVLASHVFVVPDGIADEVLYDFFRLADIDVFVKFNGLVPEWLELKPQILLEENSGECYEQFWLLATSGTTGTPKLVCYDSQRLTGTTKTDISLGKQFVWGLVFDINRFAGLQVYFQALMAGSTLVVAEQQDEIDKIITLFWQHAVNALSATPSFWRKLLMSQRASQLDLKRVTLGGEISDQTVLSNIVATYPKAAVVHIYASTEAGVGFSVKDGKEGFPEQFLHTKNPGFPWLKIVDNVLWIKSDCAANTMVSGELLKDADGYVCTGDLVTCKNNRVLFLGRDSGSINVGGNKVIPEEIESVLLQHSSVEACRVSGKKNPMMGMIVAAEVKLRADFNNTSDAKKVLIVHCQQHLEAYKVPVLIKFVDEIKVNSAGKIIRGLSS